MKKTAARKRAIKTLTALISSAVLLLNSVIFAEQSGIRLPQPVLKSAMSVEKALSERRSVRVYQPYTLKRQDISQLLWAAAGITDFSNKFRTTPSAGALYPLRIYALIGKAEDLKPGLYLYNPEKHSIALITTADLREDLSVAAYRQNAVKINSMVIVIAAAAERLESKYGQKSKQFIFLEAGHAAQNIALQAVSLGLSSAFIGAFSESEVKSLLALPAAETPLYLIPVGKKK